MELNSVQQEIVKTTEGPVMVLAGAGSGKTRVLTNRIGHILQNGLARPDEILAITFTNKAATEIKNRLFDMGLPAGAIWAMTFHSMCCRILRAEANYLTGYDSNFSIYDEQDKKNTIKHILSENNLKEDFLADVAQGLSKLKMSNLSMDEYKNICCYTPHDKQVFEIIQKYEERLQKNNAMDFDDLINKTLFLLKGNEDVRTKYQLKFRYILVDEFQDTNETQYNLVKILAGYHKNIFVVGDEDQSIYSWRGASIDNIKKFLKDFNSAKLFKLEQNYRSTKHIIDYANKIIKNNINRIDKTLWTENGEGATVSYNKSYSDRDEAEYVVSTIKGLVKDKGYSYNDIAVLMRLNALSRNFEEKLLAYGVPYKVFGGQKFYERAEIKNVMAYLKLMINPNDEESFLRIINFPKRGIGDGTIAKLRALSSTSLFDAVLNGDLLQDKALQKVEPFKELMQDLIKKRDELELYDFVCYVVDKAGIKNAYSGETEEDYNRKLNISELLQNVKQYADENSGKTLVDFLQTVSLTTDIDSYEKDGNYVSLATVHSVKGLEFKVVFIVGLEERYFPIVRCDESSESEMEEERRLMYVAITRARERLYLTCSRSRYMYGRQQFSTVSRFLKELGYEVSQNREDQSAEKYTERTYEHTRKPVFTSSINNFMHTNEKAKKEFDFVPGDRVFHTKFGIGYIVTFDSSTNTAKINFDNFGNKTLSLDFAPVKKI